jgi:hypothetical protein
LIKGTGFIDGAKVQIGFGEPVSAKFIDGNTIEVITHRDVLVRAM